MKKVIGSLSVILLAVITVRLLMGQQLKAEDVLPQTSNSSPASVNAPPSSVPEDVPLPGAEPSEELTEEIIPMTPENSTSVPTEEAVSESDTASPSEESAESSSSSDDSQGTTTTRPTDSSSSTSSSTSASMSEPSTSSSTTASSSVPTTSSTKNSSSSITSGSESSTSKSADSSGSTSSSVATTGSTAQSVEPTENPVNHTPGLSLLTTPGKVTPNPTGSIYSGISDFSDTATLDLNQDYKTSEFADSELKGFELPLLSSFEDQRQAALIYEAIKQLGVEQEEHLTNETFTAGIYQRVVQETLSEKTIQERKEEELIAGDVLYLKKGQEKQCIGIYLGDGYLLSVKEQTDSEEEKEETPSTTASTKETKKNTESTSSDMQAESEEKEVEERLVVQQTSDRDKDGNWLVCQGATKELTTYGQKLLNDYPASMDFSVSTQTQTFIETIGEDAQKLGQEYDVFASVMIAQAILESGSGTSGLSVAPYYNLFGIKGSYNGNAITMATQEDGGDGKLYTIQSAFRVYPNYAASLGDYVELIRGGISGLESYYQDVWRSKAKNYLRAAEQLTGKYATDTSYHRKLASLISVYHLTQYDKQLVEAETPLHTTSTESSIFIKGKSEIPEEYAERMTYEEYNGVDYNTSGSYPVGQCTWYAFNRVAQLGKQVDDYMGNGGEWATKGKALGYEVSQTPKAGRLISFAPGVAGSDPRYGHVAFVEAVGPDGILISEGNVYGGTTISYRVISNDLALSNQVSYVIPK